MEVIRKFSSILLALAMIFAMSATAFAAENSGSITVSNPIEGQTYTAYKIFDVTYNEDKTGYSYSISSTSEWFETVNSYNGVTLEKFITGTEYVVKMNESFSAASFANVLKAAKEGKTGTTLIEGGGTASADNLELGYYFVSSATGALCNLTTTQPDATIRDKNDMPFEKKDDKADVEVGETVNYTITSKVPDATGFNSYKYEITDTMSDGLTFQKDVVVNVGGTVLEPENYNLEQTETGFILTIKVLDIQDKIGSEIKVTYTVIVNDKAVTVVSKNNAKLEYSNDPTDGSKTTTITDEETVFSAKIIIDKFAKGNSDKKLSDAKFVLKNSNDENAKYYKYTPDTEDAPAKVEWVESKEDATEVTTNREGAAFFSGLKNGEYYLEETAAPNGYNMLTQPVKVVINGSDTEIGNLTVTAEVENNTGLVLPETGGMGTTLFYVMGGLLAIGAAVLLVVKKRMNIER